MASFPAAKPAIATPIANEMIDDACFTACPSYGDFQLRPVNSAHSIATEDQRFDAKTT